jgi:hypothetical protein
LNGDFYKRMRASANQVLSHIKVEAGARQIYDADVINFAPGTTHLDIVFIKQSGCFCGPGVYS